MPSFKVASLDALDPEQAWAPWQPSEAQPWTLKWAGHLYRRATFGASWSDLQDAVRLGPEVTLRRLLEGLPGANQRYPLLQTLGEATASFRDEPRDLGGWWIDVILRGGHPFREKLTLFWHNHFATSFTKVGRAALMFQQNELFRRHALGNFRPMLLDASKDPAMLLWLDSNSNVKGHPNENYAREVMELFSLGVGNYTEKDVQEAARAFTGWHTDYQRFHFGADLHDDGAKTFLGQTGPWNGEDVVRILLERPAAARFLVRKFYTALISEATEPPAPLVEALAHRFRTSDYDIAGLVRTILSSRLFFSEHAYRQRIKSPVEFVLGAVRAVAAQEPSPASLAGWMESMGQQLFVPPNVKGWPGATSWLNTATVLTRNNFARTIAAGEIAPSDPDQRLLSAPSERERRRIELLEARLHSTMKLQPRAAYDDPVMLVEQNDCTAPTRVVAFLVDLMLQGDINATDRERLVASAAEGRPSGESRAARVRELLHAIMVMPEYQLA
jgi:hypothetical protein